MSNFDKSEMEGKMDSRKHKCLMKNDSNVRSFKTPSVNSQLLLAVSHGSHTEVASLLESSFDQISTKTLDIAVFKASANGHKRLLQLFIRYGKNTSNKNVKGFTLLMVVSKRGYLEIVKLLVKNGADVDSKNKDGNTALFLATEKSCSVPVLEFLISSKCSADVNIQNKEGRTALMVAAQLCDIAAMRVLMHHKEINFDLQDKNGNTAFDIAKENGVDEEFSILKVCMRDNFVNPLMVSVMRSNLSLLKEFLDDDYHNVEQTNADGYTPLILALKSVSHDHKDGNISRDIVLALIKSGSDVNRLCTINTNYTCTPLLCAVETGNLEAVKLLIENGANINVQTPTSKLSALMVAAQNGFCDIVELLLTHGADHNLMDSRNYNAVSYAIENNKISCVEMFIQLCAEIDYGDILYATHMDVDLAQYLLFTSLTKEIAADSYACELLIERCINSKNYAVIEFLLDHCDCENMSPYLNRLLLTAVEEDVEEDVIKLLLDRGVYINATDDIGTTALMQAAYYNKRDVVQLLINRGADVNIVENGKTALCWAIMEHSTDALEAFLHAGIDVNYVPQDPLSKIPLHFSISCGYNDITELLISYGADINSIDHKGQTALQFAIRKHNYDIISLLIAKGADLNKQTFGGKTALHVALTIQEIESAELLIKGGADLNISDDEGKTALIICSQACTTGIMLQLLKSGADVNSVDKFESSALHCAIKHSIILTEKAEILLKYGADINKANSKGHTPFMIASQYCKDTMLRFLLDHGANINAQDKLGSTALHHASSLQSERAKFLISIGADINIQNDLGYTALFSAADTCNDLAMKVLINAGADIHAVESRTNSNLFSIILAGYNKCTLCYRENSACKHDVCMKLLINAGVRLNMSNQCTLAVYKAIICNQLKLVQLLVACGIPPLEMPRNFNDWSNYCIPHHFFTAMCGVRWDSLNFEDFVLAINASVHARSPLSTAIFCKNAAICQFFIKNWYFNEMDMSRKSLHVFHDLILNTQGTRLAAVCEEIFVQPWSLTVLSFVKVSASIGSDSDREKHIRTLPIPQILQEKLLYKSTESDLTAVWNTEIVNFLLPDHNALVGLNYMD